MRTRQAGLLASAVCAGVIGIGGAAWACVPGHDHTGPEDTNHAAHAAAQPAPAAPAPAPVAATSAPVTQNQATPTQPGATSAPAPAPAAAPAPTAGTATARTATPVRTAPAPAAPATAATPSAPVSGAQPAPAAPAPAAGITPAPEAVPVTPTTAFVETVYADVPASAESSGSGNILGVLLAGLGMALLVLGVGAAALRWRRNVGPPPLTD